MHYIAITYILFCFSPHAIRQFMTFYTVCLKFRVDVLKKKNGRQAQWQWLSVWKKKLLIPAFVLWSMCSQPVPGCVQIKFSLLPADQISFGNQGTRAFTSTCGDVKFLLHSHWAGAGKRGAPVSTGCKKALWALECGGYSCWVEKQVEALCHSLCNHRRLAKGFLLSLDV